MLILIGLLIGGILKGWQMVQSSRARSMAETAAAVQSAYLAFYDRYDHVAGDWNAVDAGNAIGTPVNGGGNDSGRLDTTAGDPWTESNAFWEQLAKSGFINGTFVGTPAEPSLGNQRAPLNVFNQPILIGRTTDFEGATSPRRHIIVGRGGSAALMRELDIKLDDGLPHQGSVRATLDDAGVSVFRGTNIWGGRQAACVNAVPEWDVSLDADDCNALLIF